MSQSLCLSSDEFNKNLCNGLSGLQRSGQFVDMTLAADGHFVKVHQIVMALASPYIKGIVSSIESSHPVIFLNKTSHSTLRLLLEYIYTGEVVVAMECIEDFMEAAKELCINGLDELEILYSADKNQLQKPVERNTRSNCLKREECAEDVSANEDELNSSLLFPLNAEDKSGYAEDKSGYAEDKSGYAEDKSGPEETLEDEIMEVDYKVTKRKKRVKSKIRLKGDDYEEIEGYKGESRWFARDGYYYVAARVRGPSTGMRCAGDRCSARWTLRHGIAGPVSGAHFHERTPWVPSRNSMFQALKRRVRTESLPLNTIYEEEAMRFPDAVPHLLYESVAPSMRKWRRAIQALATTTPSTPATPATPVTPAVPAAPVAPRS